MDRRKNASFKLVIFLCGRPGCGQESTATLQIDAPSTTVSLVDPRISRDGVPLCGRHADSTTPPMGWSMNDLRSRSRSLAAVADEDASPQSTPPRVRPEGASDESRSSGQRMSPRQSIEERARQDVQRQVEDEPVNSEPASAQANGQRLTKKQRRAARAAQRAKEREQRVKATAAESAENGQPESVASSPAAVARGTEQPDGGVPSRPNRRRETEESPDPEEEKFPWHFQFDDDEPDQLQASSPLLSRAFRATIG